ncbi:MAG: penicillin-binding protein 2 [Desulfobacterales bacterium]
MQIKHSDHEWYRVRLAGMLGWIVLVFAILLGRLFYLTAIEGTEYRRLSENNCIRLQRVDAPRGLIFDRRGRLLVDNRPSYDVALIPKDAQPLDGTLNKLARHLALPFDDVRAVAETERHSPAYKPVVIREDVDRNALAVVTAHGFELPGVVVQVKPRRQYLTHRSAAHILGYLGEINARELESGKFPDLRSGDTIGKFGTEKTFDNFLRGEKGGRQVEVNAAGQVVRVLQTVDFNPGYNIYLTLDAELQRRAEMLLEGVAGAAVAMDPNTGNILVLASSPTFDQNDFVSGLSQAVWTHLQTHPQRPMQNRAIQGEYPPGSTYKIITALAALEEGVCDESTTVFCPGFYRYGDRTYRCWKRGGHGHVNMRMALERSCDVYFYQMGQKLGVDRLAWYAKAAGLGAPSGIDLDHESEGLVPGTIWKQTRYGKPWMGGETLSVAIGQGYNLTTPIQLAGMMAAVANGGTRFAPAIVTKIETAQGERVFSAQPRQVGTLPVKARTLNIVREGLSLVVQGKRGTARGYRLPEIEYSGKTGTSQVFSHKRGDPRREVERPFHLRPHAWFVAYAPSDNPQIAVAVVVEHGEHGSSAAAPVAREVIRTFLAPKDDAPGLMAGKIVGIQGRQGAGVEN